MPTLAVLALALSAPVTTSQTAGLVSLQNDRVKVMVAPARGVYSVIDRATGETAVAAAQARIGAWSIAEPGRRTTVTLRRVRDALGHGAALRLASAADGRPTLLLDIAVYDDSGFLTLGAGLSNVTSAPVQVTEMQPLAGAVAYPRLVPKNACRTLNGPGGSGDTRVETGLSRQSQNNLLLTFVAEGGRRSLVFGGLVYEDYVKVVRSGNAGTSAARIADLERRWPQLGRVVAYLDCGENSASPPGGPQLRLAQGRPFVWIGSQEVAPLQHGSVAFDEQGLTFEIDGLDPARHYVLGWSWWDFDHNGREQSVRVDGAPVVARTALPAWRDRQQPPEERAAVVPPESAADGRLTIVFTDEAHVSNAVAGEIWLWECEQPVDPPPALRDGAAVVVAPESDRVSADVGLLLRAVDPVGRRVEPGETYLPSDRFYLDATTRDPFAALEAYGRRLRAAMGAPNPYDFPTSCAWYIGLFAYPAGNRPERSKYLIATSAGLVEEMEKCRDSGFLAYSRAAMRLVPDTYVANSEQGWWDDEHWQRHLHYTPPYETTAKFCAGIRAAGGLPFTYFQSDRQADDFRAAHPDWMLGNDPARTLDVTAPGAIAHLQRVYANLRAGGMAGMMFDYPDGLWAHLAQGGFEDPHATAAAAYRRFFQLAKEGLGPDSWIHERILGEPYSDLTIGVVDSQRVWGDTSAIEPQMIGRCGLRWYKNRVVMAYDMDAKDLLAGWKRPGFEVDPRDGRRTLLTMAYVAASRLLLATSYRDLPPEALWDLQRTFPYPTTPQSARPVDAFVTTGWPRIYDFAVSPEWHQLTLLNVEDPPAARTFAVPLSGEPAAGALGLDPRAHYHVYDFWNDRYVGAIRGAARLVQTLRPGEARMLSIHRVAAHPQFLSTNRHLMQGYLDLPGRPAWDARSRRLGGIARVVQGEPFRVVLALNGYRPLSATARGAAARLEPASKGLVALTLDGAGDVPWSVAFTR